MAQIFTLQIAINDYPNRVDKLQQPVKDLEKFNQFLSHKLSGPFQSKILLNQDATRQNIIRGFNHFSQAKRGDVCLFYFAGHGSRTLAPFEFEEVAADGMIESIVCYDSRLSGGYDLTDKEISYLIHQATQRGAHFLAIMDCCFSGDITRKEEDFLGELRTLAPSHTPRRVEDFEGFSSYQSTPNGSYRVPIGRHVLLSASAAHQTANRRADFTGFLIKAIQSGAKNYQEIINSLTTKISARANYQCPQLFTTHPEDAYLPFLNGLL